MSFTKRTINRLSRDACPGEGDRQHYVFIFVAKGLRRCRLISFFGSSGHCGRDHRVLLRGAGTIWHTSCHQSLHNEMPNSCSCSDGSQPRHHRSPFIINISLRDSGIRLRCRSYFFECAPKAPKVYLCIVVESACYVVVQYPIRGSHGSNAPWVFEHV